METNKNIQNNIDQVFKSVDTITDVKVSPFFKDKVMQKVYAEKEIQETTWSWFTPKLQFATLACVVVLNVFALTQFDSVGNDSDLEEFSNTYELIINDDNAIYN